MKFSVENDPDWLSKCQIERRGDRYLAQPAGSIVPALVDESHLLYPQLKAEYERRLKAGITITSGSRPATPEEIAQVPEHIRRAWQEAEAK